MKEQVSDPDLLALVEKEERVAGHIVRQIEFTKNYEELGVSAPIWQDVAMSINALKSARPPGIVNITTKLDGLEVYADPLFLKVNENLIDNSIRHGERAKNITVSWLPYSNNAIALVYEDDGVGIHGEDKERIFEKGFGKNTGLGLFLIREILAITGITIRERGTYGKGVRFEIHIPRHNRSIYHAFIFNNANRYLYEACKVRDREACCGTWKKDILLRPPVPGGFVHRIGDPGDDPALHKA
jgi:signal transduction histidine kinase